MDGKTLLKKELFNQILAVRFAGKQAEFARAIKKSPSQIHQWSSGYRAISHETARHIEKTLKLSFGWMDGIKQNGQQTTTTSEVTTEGYVTFDLLDIKAAAGDGYHATEYPEVVQQVNVLESWAHKELGNDLSRIRLISASGTSMQGTIENGDVLFVDAAVRKFDGDGIYVIARDENIQVKRLQKLHGGALAIISDNRAYETEKLMSQDANTVIICGRVLAAWSLKRLW